MRFGLQKLTLLDYPGKVACTLFTCGCNFRCPFCHNSLLVTGTEDSLDYSCDEVFAVLKSRRKILDGVCITGGEPLLHSEIEAVVKEIKALGYLVKLDTNGSFPGKLKCILDSGIVDYVAMDIKNSPEKYEKTCGGKSVLESVQQSVDILRNGNVAFEFRTTAVGGFHDVSDFEKIGKWLQGVPRYFIQSYKNSGDILNPTPEMESLT